MTKNNERDVEFASGPSHFRTTAWSVVLGAQDEEAVHRDECLAELCRQYWKPIFYYMRRRGLSMDDARDLTQEYFATFLEKDFVAAADRERGKFRTFVLVTVSRFLGKNINKWRNPESRRSIQIQVDDGEEVMELPELAHGETAEDEFNRRWAMGLIEKTLSVMRKECDHGKRKQYYDAFIMFLDASSSSDHLSYRDMAESMGVTETDVTNFLYRGRSIFQKLLRDQIRESVDSESGIDDEIEALKNYLRR